MAHILSRLRNVKFDVIKDLLTEHAPIHAQYGLYMEQIWQNADDADEVIFLFRTDDLGKAKAFIQKTHAEARAEDPDANLPHMTFLQDEE